MPVLAPVIITVLPSSLTMEDHWPKKNALTQDDDGKYITFSSLKLFLKGFQHKYNIIIKGFVAVHSLIKKVNSLNCQFKQLSPSVPHY